VDAYHIAAAAAALVALGGCRCGGSRSEPPSEPEPPAARAAPDAVATAAGDEGCAALPFADSIDLAEASGADLVPDGSALMVVGDSGHRGSYVLLDPESGAVLESGQLEHEPAQGDDFEGLARRGERVLTITSSGFVQTYERIEGGFARRGGAYAIAEAPWVCEPGRANCGPNWEGLCLGELDPAHGGCAGFVASKRDGKLYCVELDADGRLALEPSRSIQVSPPQTLAGCAIDGRGHPWAVTNLIGASAILEVAADWTVTARLSWAPGSSEAVAFRGADIYRFSDTSGRPSLANRYRCP
jgi:hypothetical protein